MALPVDRLDEEAVTQGAEVGDSLLDGIRGSGTIQVVRGRHRDVVEVLGSWRPHDESADTSSLERAAENDEPVRFEGRLDDPADPDRTRVVGSFVITSYGDYRYDATLPEGEEGPVLRLFNLRPADDEPGWTPRT